MAAERFSFVSIITSNNFLEGVLVLHYSLGKTNSKYPFLLLVTPNISEEVLKVLSKHGIQYAIVQNIENPTQVDAEHRWFPTYPKLNIFGLIQFDKLVYLDADMVVFRNIDELFERPHMSAVNAGGLLPERCGYGWTSLNSGLLVVEPSLELFQDMLSKVGTIEKVETGSDQDFLQAYYLNWPEQKELHLDHGYNIFYYDLDSYSQLFGYSFSSDQYVLRVIHYAGDRKPWHMYKERYGVKLLVKSLLRKLTPIKIAHELQDESIKLWFRHYRNLVKL
jgi:glycogenin